MTRVALALFLLSFPLPWLDVPAAQGPARPAVVSPFPAGLSGTLVFTSDIAGPDNPSSRPHLYTLDLRTGVVGALTQGRDFRDESPRWSPDGSRIAFSSTRAGAHHDLYVMDADGRNVTRVTDDPANDQDPSWMPDGRSLVFSSDRDSRGDLYRVRLADRRVDRLTRNFVGRAIMPAVSPDGRSVAFAAQTLERLQFWEFQVHVLDLATGRTRALPGTGGACWPSWAPDGRTMANVSLAREPSTLQVRDPDGGGERRLAGDTARWHYYPDYSPDGRWVALSVSPEHHDGEDWDLAIVPADGSRPVQRLTTGPGNDRLPDWKP